MIATLTLLNDDHRRHRRRKVAVEGEVRIVQTLADLVGNDVFGQHCVGVGRMRADEHVRDDRARDRKRGADREVRQTIGETLAETSPDRTGRCARFRSRPRRRRRSAWARAVNRFRYSSSERSNPRPCAYARSLVVARYSLPISITSPAASPRTPRRAARASNPSRRSHVPVRRFVKNAWFIQGYRSPRPLRAPCRESVVLTGAARGG